MYERHAYSDIKFPIKFHQNTVYAKGSPLIPPTISRGDIIGSGAANWHEGIEILRMIDGTGNVHINSVGNSEEKISGHYRNGVWKSRFQRKKEICFLCHFFAPFR